MTPERALFREPTPRDKLRDAWSRVSRVLSRPWVVWTLFLLVVAGVIWFHLPSMHQPLLEHHSFRQTQTAWTALIFHEQGIDLFHPKIPVFGPPYDLPFEFPLYQAIAALVMNAGVAPDLAMRITGLATFLLAMLLISRLVARLAGEAAAFVAVLAFAVCGLGLLWARTSTIEYFVVDASLAMLYGALRWHESRHWAWWALALGAGVIAMLVKPTTAVMYVPALLALGWYGWRAGRERPLTKPLLYGAALLALIAIPLLFGGLWTIYADKIKAANPFTVGQTSAALTTWNFGTIPQRLNPDTWGLILGRVNDGGDGLLTKTPVLPASDNHIRRTTAFGLAADGSASFVDDTEIRGQMAPAYRQHYQAEGDRLAKYEKQWNGSLPGIQLDKVSFGPGVAALELPVTVHAEGKVPQLGAASAGGWSVPVTGETKSHAASRGRRGRTAAVPP
jgi:hypothetical protein